jgi:two-component system LytT family response regulator
VASLKMTIRTKKLDSSYNKQFYTNLRALILLCLLIYGLAIFQDYLFSRFKSTGFYWSDTLLYNNYWLLFIPSVQFANYAYGKFQPNTGINKMLYTLGSGLIFSISHIFVFTSIFILLSNLIYPTPHRFSTIIKNVISNQSQITIITYLFFPFAIEYLNRKKQQKNNVSTLQFLTVKNGTRITKLNLSDVLVIKTDRPYSAIFSLDQKLLHDESLKKLESLLDPNIFIRVHRSAIVNKNHIKEISSRKNGDYDAILTNQHSVRLSRHYRLNWKALLNH